MLGVIVGMGMQRHSPNGGLTLQNERTGVASGRVTIHTSEPSASGVQQLAGVYVAGVTVGGIRVGVRVKGTPVGKHTLGVTMMRQGIRVAVGTGVGVRVASPESLPPPHPSSIVATASVSRDPRRIRQHSQRDERGSTAALASSYTAHDTDGAGGDR